MNPPKCPNKNCDGYVYKIEYTNGEYFCAICNSEFYGDSIREAIANYKGQTMKADEFKKEFDKLGYSCNFPKCVYERKYIIKYGNEYQLKTYSCR